MALEVRPVAGRGELNTFIKLPWRLYRNEPNWVPPLLFERKQFWEAHRVMNEEPYWHLENLCNLEQIGRSHGFKLAVFPIKWVNTTAAPVRAVAIIED